MDSKNNNNSVDDGYRVFVEGSWKGEIDGSEMVTTFIEGEFENEPTLTGSTSLSTGESFLIVNGGHNRVDRIWFSLIRIPYVELRIQL
ncbi:MAG TPA: hypothetical protein VK141_11325 [Nitrosomonas sp.]|nr:hypothetical protein [Nitrosomonas sp.]